MIVVSFRRSKMSKASEWFKLFTPTSLNVAVSSSSLLRLSQLFRVCWSNKALPLGMVSKMQASWTLCKIKRGKQLTFTHWTNSLAIWRTFWTTIRDVERTDRTERTNSSSYRTEIESYRRSKISYSKSYCKWRIRQSVEQSFEWQCQRYSSTVPFPNCAECSPSPGKVFRFHFKYSVDCLHFTLPETFH